MFRGGVGATTSHKEKALHTPELTEWESLPDGEIKDKTAFKYLERASMCNNEHQEAKLEPSGDCFMIAGFHST